MFLNDNSFKPHSVISFEKKGGIMVKKIMALGVLLIMVFTFAGCSEKNFIEIETEDMIELHTWFFTSGVPNNAIVLKHENKNIVFECSVDNGDLKALSTQYMKNLNANSGDIIYWKPDTIIEQAFVDIVLKSEDYIVGYAVIEILQDTSSVDHTASVLKSVLIPKIDGEYQKVTEKQVETAIEKIKTK